MTSGPGFERPPLREVVFSVQTEPIERFTTAHFGLFWSEIRDLYPQVEVHAALDPSFEDFGEPENLVQRGFRLLERFETPRCWFISLDGASLIQLQQDRLIYNWRYREGAGSYPGYEVLRPAFEKHARRFIDFLGRESLGEFVPNQIEISYINHVRTEGWPSRGNLSRAFSFLPPFSSIGLDEPEDASFSARFRLNGETGSIGRLHASLNPARLAADNDTVLLFNLTARGTPTTRDLSGSLEFLDMGRQQIHKAFLALTNADVQHATWGRK